MKFQVTYEYQQAFHQLKKAFTSPPILRHFNHDFPSIVERDTSDFVLGVILSQRHEGHLNPVAFHSRKFYPAEVNYEVYDKEMLAIVDSLKQWQYYLKGAKHLFIVHTDHKNFAYFLTTKSLYCRQARWVKLIANYDFTIVYGKGASNAKADTLPRHSEYRP